MKSRLRVRFTHFTPGGGGGGGVLTYYGKRGSAALMGDFSAKSP